jgi:hypothetical protein
MAINLLNPGFSGNQLRDSFEMMLFGTFSIFDRDNFASPLFAANSIFLIKIEELKPKIIYGKN